MRRALAMLLACLSLCIGPIGAGGCSPTRALRSADEPAFASEIRLLAWVDEIPQSVLDAFEEEYNVKVIYIEYQDEEGALASVHAGEDFDVVTFYTDYVAQLIQDGLAAELDYQNIPNFKNIAPNFRDLTFDPNSAHSIATSWGSTGLLVRTDLVPRPVTHWADLWEMEEITIGMRDEPRDSLGVALRSLGYSINTEDPQHIEEAYERLLQIKDRVQIVGVNASDAVPLLESGEVTVIIGWQEDALAMRERPVPSEYILPEDGAMLWVYSYLIPATSTKQRTAELFLDFLLRPDVAAEVASFNGYPCTNAAAQPLLDPEVRDDPVINPQVDRLVRGAEVQVPLSDVGTELYASYWAQFRAALP